MNLLTPNLNIVDTNVWYLSIFSFFFKYWQSFNLHTFYLFENNLYNYLIMTNYAFNNVVTCHFQNNC